MKFAIIFLLAFELHLKAQAQLIVGVTDRAVYTDFATFTVPAAAGFTYEVTLNDTAVAAGVSQVVNVMDYYDLVARRTQVSDGSITSQSVRFGFFATRQPGGRID